MAIWASRNGADCRTCYEGRKIAWNCNGDKEGIARTYFGHSMVLNKCPVKLISATTKYYLSLYSHYKNGFLPSGRGIKDESFRFIKMMELIEGTLAEIEQREAENARSK